MNHYPLPSPPFSSIIIPSPREYVSKSLPFSLKTEQRVPRQPYDHLTYPREDDVNTIHALTAKTNHKTSRFQKYVFWRSHKCIAFQYFVFSKESTLATQPFQEFTCLKRIPCGENKKKTERQISVFKRKHIRENRTRLMRSNFVFIPSLYRFASRLTHAPISWRPRQRAEPP